MDDFRIKRVMARWPFEHSKTNQEVISFFIISRCINAPKAEHRKAVWNLIRKRAHKGTVPITVEVKQPREALQYIYCIEKRPLRLILPAAMLRMQGAFVYGPGHPFVMALQHGPEKLEEFYSGFTPRNIAEMYAIPLSNKAGEDLPPWELPWLLRLARTAPKGERGLTVDDGVSFYGPATGKKVSLEYERLQKTALSIKTKGYQPDRYGDIEGHFMTDGQNVCFFVRGGKHRAAALAFLGHEKIPVRLRRSWPLVIDARSARDWPLVAEGKIDADLAVDILQAYLRGKDG
ncbi:MAG: hypothetical protein JRD39_02495 [Deltaproteobacteria bacterium]|nr:hypothetical protein [Deltaproteobacteria bacterium]